MPLLTTGAGAYAAAGGGSLDPATTAWVAAVVSAGGTVSGTQQTNVDTLIKALKGHSLFSIQDRIWLHASENTQQATIDIVNLGVATPHGSLVSGGFVANQGYTGDGSTGYLDTNYAEATNGVNFTRNSGSVSAYDRTIRTGSGSGGGVNIGVYDGAASGNATLLSALNNGQFSYDVNDPAFSNQPSNLSAQGFWTASRTGSGALAVYKNSNSTAFDSATTSSLSLSTLNFLILALNNSGTPSGFCPDQIAISTIGGGMTNTQSAQFQTDLNAYMTSLGTNVY